MRRFDKEKNLHKANLLAEQRYLNLKEGKVNEYDNYNYPAGADADPNAPWNQGPDIDPEYEYEYREGEYDWDEVLDDNYNGPLEGLQISFVSVDGGTHITTFGEIFKKINMPNEMIDVLKVNNITPDENKSAQEVHNQTGTYPEEFIRKTSNYNKVYEKMIEKYTSEPIKYEYEVERDERDYFREPD